jgi:hypothetical protein
MKNWCDCHWVTYLIGRGENKLLVTGPEATSLLATLLEGKGIERPSKMLSVYICATREVGTKVVFIGYCDGVTWVKDVPHK